MKENILLVEDDPAVRRMLYRVLEDEKYHVAQAANSSQALEMAAAKAPDLALLDINLPSSSGWEVFEKLTNIYPCLPIIIITARPNQLFPALASGVGALMEKPLDLPKLLWAIRHFLEESPQARMGRSAGRSAEFHYLPPTQAEPQPLIRKKSA